MAENDIYNDGNAPINGQPEGVTLNKILGEIRGGGGVTPPPAGQDFLTVNETTGAITGPVTAAQFINANGISSNLRGNLLFVDPLNGDDATAESGTTKAYLTISAAITAASSGETVVVYPGTYDENVTAKNGVNMLFLPNAVVSPTTGSALSVPTGVTCVISGDGSFISTEDNAHAVSLTGTGTCRLSAYLIQSQGVSAAGLFSQKDDYYVEAFEIISNQYDGIWSAMGSGVMFVNRVYGADQGIENTGTLDITAQSITGETLLVVTTSTNSLTIRNATIFGGDVVYNDFAAPGVAGNLVLDTVTFSTGTVDPGFAATIVMKNCRVESTALGPALGSTSTLQISGSNVLEILNDSVPGWWTGEYINGSGDLVASNNLIALGANSTAPNQTAAEDASLMTRGLTGDEPFWDLGRVFRCFSPAFGNSGTGSASAAGVTAELSASGGTATSGYARITLARGLTTYSAMSGAGINFSRVIAGSFKIGTNMATTFVAGELARIIFGGNGGVPATASADALSSRGFGIEIGSDGSTTTRWRLFAHNGTTYVTSAWQSFADTSLADDLIQVVLSSDGAGTVTANVQKASSALTRTFTTLTLSGGPTSVMGSGQYVDAVCVNPTSGTPASVNLRITDAMFMVK